MKPPGQCHILTVTSGAEAAAESCIQPSWCVASQKGMSQDELLDQAGRRTFCLKLKAHIDPGLNTEAKGKGKNSCDQQAQEGTQTVTTMFMCSECSQVTFDLAAALEGAVQWCSSLSTALTPVMDTG